MPGENKNPAGEAGATGAAGAATLKRIPDKKKVEQFSPQIWPFGG